MVDMFRMYCQIIDLANAVFVHYMLSNILPVTSEAEEYFKICEMILMYTRIEIALNVAMVHPFICLACFVVAIAHSETVFVSA